MATLDLDLGEPGTIECPYPAYERLRDEAPVWFDARTQMYVVTRYDDVRAVLVDAKRFSSGKRGEVPRWPLMRAVYEEQGWVPGTSLGGLDNPEHKQLRNLFNHAFRPDQISRLEAYMASLAHDLIDGFAGTGRCEFMHDFAVPLPLFVIGRQMGVADADMGQIKAWTDSWIQRRGMMMSDEEIVASTELEVEAQHYFQPIFERLREVGDDSLLSDLVRTEIPEWGRPLTDNELHAEMMADMFVGGAETATSAIASGMAILIEQPDLWQQIRADPGCIPAFAEEVLRFESPVQGLFRRVTEDVVLGGVEIPAGALVNARYGAANRDDRKFECPGQFRLDRPNGRQHLAFGQGTHQCLGAHLARLELRVAFEALARRLDGIGFVDGANDFRHRPNMVVRGLEQLHMTCNVRAR